MTNNKFVLVPAFIIVAAALSGTSFWLGASTQNEFRRPTNPLAGFETEVAESLKEWDVPGVAIGVVKDDQVVFSDGFGVRQLGEQSPVDEETLFSIASTSKGFTTAALAMLIDERKLDWDRPVVEVIPEFALFDPYATREANIRDLACHRVGIPRADSIWYQSTADLGTILRKVASLPPEKGFRRQFGYNNVMYLILGAVIQSAGGQSWNEMIEQRIFTPLGMNASSSRSAVLATAPNASKGHDFRNGQLTVLPTENVDSNGPATGIVSNIRDMTAWVRFQLGSGEWAGKRVISAEAMAAMHAPQIPIPPADNLYKMFPDKQSLDYGLGWMIMGYRGRVVILHPGNIMGMRALVAMIPDENLGVVILANRTLTPLPIDLMYTVFDRYLGPKTKEEQAARRQQLHETEREFNKRAEAKELWRKGQTLAAERKFDEAIQAIQQAMEIEADDPALFHQLAHVQMQSRRLPDALATLQRLLEKWPRYVEAYDLRGVLFAAQGDVESASASYTRALSIHPRYLPSLLNRASLERRGGNSAAAIADATLALAIDDQLPAAYATRGLALAMVHDDEAAAKDFAKSAALNASMKPALEKEVAAIKAKRGVDPRVVAQQAAEEKARAERARAEKERADFERDLRARLEKEFAEKLARERAEVERAVKESTAVEKKAVKEPKSDEKKAKE